MLRKTISIFFIFAAGLLLFIAAKGLTSLSLPEDISDIDTPKEQAIEYVWTGAAGDGFWSSAGNWEPEGPPPRNSGAVKIQFSEDMNMQPVTIPAGFTADCTFGDNFGSVFGPAFGMHLDIKGSLTYKWYLSAGQTNPAGQRSIINMYSGSSIQGAEGLAIGDNWWLPGPYVTMNMFGNSIVDVNWLWVGGHINMYGGTMNIKQGVNMCIRHNINGDANNIVKVDDSLTRVDIYAGKLNLPADVNKAVVEDWISRGILLAYGKTPGKDGCYITIDTQSQPGRTIISAVDDTGTMADIYSNEKDDEAELWGLMEKAVSSIERKKFSDANAIVEGLFNNFKSNPRTPQVLNYISDMYEAAKKYDEASKIQKAMSTNWSQSRSAGEINFESAKIDIIKNLMTFVSHPKPPLTSRGLVIQSLDLTMESNTVNKINELIKDFGNRNDLSSAVFNIASNTDLENRYEPNEFTKKLYQIVLQQFPSSPQAASAKLSVERINLTFALDNNEKNIPSLLDKFIEDHNNVPGIFEEVSKIAEYYQQKILKNPLENSMRRQLVVCDKIIERFSDNYNKFQAYKLAGNDCYALGEYDRALGYYQKIVDSWPENKDTGNILFKIGQCYRWLQFKGILKEDEANMLIKECHERIVKDYPDCAAAKAAANLIKKYEKLQEGGL